MWADAQRDGRPAEYKWRPLRKFRSPGDNQTSRSLDSGERRRCSNEAKTQKPLKFARLS